MHYVQYLIISICLYLGMCESDNPNHGFGMVMNVRIGDDTICTLQYIIILNCLCMCESYYPIYIAIYSTYDIVPLDMKG